MTLINLIGSPTVPDAFADDQIESEQHQKKQGYIIINKNNICFFRPG